MLQMVQPALFTSLSLELFSYPYKYKLPIDLVHTKPARMITFSTWDRLKLPLPFAKVQFDSIRVMASEFDSDTGKTLSKEELNQSVSKLHEKMQLISGDLKAN